MDSKDLFSREVVDLIMKILKRGDTVELKKENNKLVIVEIQRKVKNKSLLS
ncbi:MAG: hypothetical protein J1F03_00180 [Oscillospiraceae bacterium]|nr:hypothetical protein [Oscillospiraceae bacterium]